MVIDASALIAILMAEPESERLVRAIAAAGIRHIGAPTIVEAAAVMLARRGPGGEIALDAMLQRLEMVVIPMTVEAGVHARAAHQRFGKGVGSPAVLNYGDCLSYGVAMAEREPLLFVGEDFAKTDVLVAAY